METRRAPVLDIRNLNVFLPRPDGTHVQILHDVNLTVEAGSIKGVIGESGSGKSMTALAVLRLLPANAWSEGEILVNGVDLLDLPDSAMKEMRGRHVSMIFQEPMTALDPVFTIGFQLSQTLRAHEKVSRQQARDESIEMLTTVGIPDPIRRFDEYPHQLSGGMRQRVMIAMALICKPKLLIADEPTTAVDITIQAQLLELLVELNSVRDTAIMLISHDIAVISEVCRDVAVMYAGEVVESCRTDDLLERPAHPYASGLMWAVPRIESRGSELQAIRGRVPLPHELPEGCRFHPRCDHALESCAAHRQVMVEADNGHVGHLARCERVNEIELIGVDGPVERSPRSAGV
ncbi:MAG: ABC transporter ATP-binding protein [Acidimicrobiales bacterium]